jgi:MerR HTH family regulatory protein
MSGLGGCTIAWRSRPPSVAQARSEVPVAVILGVLGRAAVHVPDQVTRPSSCRYSRRDIERLAEICTLTADGLNLAGIRRVLQLQEETRQLQAELARLRALAGDHAAPAPRTRTPQARSRAGRRTESPPRPD